MHCIIIPLKLDTSEVASAPLLPLLGSGRSDRASLRLQFAGASPVGTWPRATLVVARRRKLLKLLLQPPRHKFVKLVHRQGRQCGQVVNSLRYYFSPCLGISFELDFHRYGKAVTGDEKQVECSSPFRKVQLTGDKRNPCRIFIFGVIVILKKFRVFFQHQFQLLLAGKFNWRNRLCAGFTLNKDWHASFFWRRDCSGTGKTMKAKLHLVNASELSWVELFRPKSPAR